ncbi:ABC transporter substrate-binding protein [Microbacterium rhizomatis]|uniref:Peptide ABC transporter substrate-binding protein n=1 Tax=Microbacterium rhizomatis TaxID=1631477 RepID=A0A5J5J1A6_9MICO|nr:ABC transporter substrate-binding protein [Microbacterium rhizomatis]KAA9105877.1 peptide ABC transporter substrate-binding protein [Microbacterium rhizomatis]
MRKRRLLSAAALVVAVTVAITACTSTATDDEESTESPTLRIGSSAAPESFDPAELSLGVEIPQFWMLTYDTLLKLNADGTVSPNLATEWSYDESNTKLEVTLRDDVTFTDGAPLNAEAVKANIEHIQAGAGRDKAYADAIAATNVVDDFTVEFELSEPDPMLLTNLARNIGAVGSPEALTTEAIKTTPVGSGPYILDTAATVVGSNYTYDRNPDYWNSEAWPYDRIELLVYTDLTARVNALKAGQVDATWIDGSTAAEVEASGLTVTSSPAEWVGMKINDRAGAVVPALGDLRVRQAINMAFDSQAMLENIDLGFGSLTNVTVLPGSNGFVEALQGTYEYDPDGARKLLAEAGYPDGFDLPMPQFPFRAAYNPTIESALGDIGIRVIWKDFAPTETVQQLYDPTNAMFMTALNGARESWDFYSSAVTPDASGNIAQSTDPELEALLDTARSSSEEDREQANQAVQTWLVENAWFAPWYYRDTVYATSDAVTFEPQFGDALPLISTFAPANSK